MKRTAKQLSATAYHEAGHFVVAGCCGIPVHLVSIIPNEEKNTLGVCCIEHPGWFKPDEIVDDRTELLIQKHIVMRFAGNEAERKGAAKYNYFAAGNGSAKYNYVGAKEDYQSLTELALHMCSPEEADAMLKWLRLRAKNLVNDPLNWAGIKGVAQALLECRELTGEEAKDIMEQMREAARSQSTQIIPFMLTEQDSF